MSVVVTQLIVDSSGAKQGVAEFEAAMAKAKAAAVDGGTATATSFEKAQERWAKSLGATDPVIKAQIAQQQALAKQQAINEKAVSLGIATQAAAAAQLAKVQAQTDAHVKSVREQTGQLTAGERAMVGFRQALSGVSGQLVAMSAGAGPVGVFLAALGPWGIAAAAGIGIATLGIKEMVEMANKLAEQAGKMVDFAETTGLTTTQLQALQKAAAFVGIDAEKVGQGFEKFTTSLEELKRGTGTLYDGLNRINPALTRQLALARDAGAAWDVLSKAIAGANREQANAIARAAFGRTGIPFTRLANATNEAGGLSGLARDLGSVNTLSPEELKRWDDLKDKIDYTTRLAKQNFASIFTGDVLKAQEKASNELLRLSRIAKDFSMSDDLRKLIRGPSTTGELPGAFEPFGWLKVLIDMLPFLRQIQTGGLAAGPMDRASFNDRFAPSSGSLKPFTPEADPKLDPRFNLAALQKQIAAMGDAATSADRLRAAEMQLAISAKEAGLSQTQYNAALAALRSAEKLSDMRDMISALGSSATVTELYTYKVAQLTRQLDLGRISQETYNRAVEGLKRDQTIQAERDRLSVLGDTATETDQYRLRVMELQRQLDQGRISQETFNQALIAADPLFRKLTDTAGTFTTSLINGLASGKNFADSLRGALEDVSKSMLKIGTDNLTGGFKTLLSGGGLSGFDPVSLGIGAAGAALSFFTGAEKERKKREEEQQRAWERWTAAAETLRVFIATGNGQSAGTVQTAIADFTKQYQDLLKLRADAIGAAGAGFDPVIQQMWDALQAFTAREVEKFTAKFDVMVGALEQGFGPDSVFAQAGDKIDKAGDSLKAFVADAQYVGANMDRARTAAQDFAKTLLQPEQALTDTQRGLQTIAGSVSQLWHLFIDLGMGVEQANAALNKAWEDAINTLRTNFTEDLQRKINDALGTGYLNDFADLIKQVADATKDAASLGTGTDLVDRFFGVQAQKIVDDAQLTGQAFADLVAQFPQLQGVVHEFVQSATQDADTLLKRQQDFRDRAFVALQDQQTLAGALAVFDLKAQREREAEIAAGGGAIVDLEAALAADRLNVIQGFNDHAIEVEQQAADARKKALDEARDYLASFAKSITAFIAQLQGGSGSALSPGDRLAAAQGYYNSQLVLAQAGDRDALGSITQTFSSLLDAAKAFYGSSTAFQNIRLSGIADLTALPSQVRPEDLIIAAIVAQTGTLTDRLLTVEQMQALGLATNTQVGTLLTQSQLTQLGLASNATVGGLLTAAQLAQAGLATNPTLVTTNTAIGTLLTQSQLQAAGLAANTTVAGLLTAAQLAQAGLAQNAVVSGLLTQSQVTALGLAKDTSLGNTSPIVSALGPTGAIAANAGATAANVNTVNTSLGPAGAIASNTGTVAVSSSIVASNTGASGQLAANTGASGQLATNTGASGALAQLLTTSRDHLALMKDQLTQVPVVAGAAFGGINVSNNMLTALNKIVYNTGVTAYNTKGTYGTVSGNGANGFVGLFAEGGYTGNMGAGDIAGLVHGREYVLNAAATRSIGLDALNFANDNGRLPSNAASDNSDIVAELRTIARSVSEIATLRRQLDRALSRLEAIERGTAETAQSTGRTSNKIDRALTGARAAGRAA